MEFVKVISTILKEASFKAVHIVRHNMHTVYRSVY